MKILVSKIIDQIYLIPFIKITYKRFLNGDLELIIGWFNYCLIISI